MLPRIRPRRIPRWKNSSASCSRKCAVPSPVQTPLPRRWKPRSVWPPKPMRNKPRTMRCRNSSATLACTNVCRVCGYRNRQGNKFCGMCGFPMTGDIRSRISRRATASAHARARASAGFISSITSPKPGRQRPGRGAGDPPLPSSLSSPLFSGRGSDGSAVRGAMPRAIPRATQCGIRSEKTSCGRSRLCAAT